MLMSDSSVFSVSRLPEIPAASKRASAASSPSTALLQDLLVEELIRLSHAAMEAGVQTDSCTALLADGLFTTLTNVNFDDASIKRFTDRVRAMRRRLDSPGSERKERFIAPLWEGDTDTVSLRSTLLFGLKGMAAYAHHAARLGFHDPEVDGWFYRGSPS